MGQSNIFKQAFELINSKFSDNAFTRFNSHGEATGRLAPAYFEAVCASVVTHHSDLLKFSGDDLLVRLRRAFDSDEFKSATGPGANTVPKLHQRIAVVSKFLLNK